MWHNDQIDMVRSINLCGFIIAVSHSTLGDYALLIAKVSG